MKKNPFVRLIEWMLVFLLAAMVVLVFGNVVLRYCFSSGLVFSEEFSRFCFVWLTLLGAIVVMYEGGHLGMYGVVAKLPIAGQRICRFASDLLVLITAGLLTDGAWRQVMLGMDEHAPVTGIPLGIVFSALFICSLSMVFLAARSLWLQMRGQVPDDRLFPRHDSASNGDTT